MNCPYHQFLGHWVQKPAIIQRLKSPLVIQSLPVRTGMRKNGRSDRTLLPCCLTSLRVTSTLRRKSSYYFEEIGGLGDWETGRNKWYPDFCRLVLVSIDFAATHSILSLSRNCRSILAAELMIKDIPSEVEGMSSIMYYLRIANISDQLNILAKSCAV
jgi:hypothetical protein